jgi:hypothetical protein
MTLRHLTIAAAAAAMLVGAPTVGLAQDAHTIVSSGEIKWTPGPASIPRGAEAAAPYGDASKEGLFALRLKLPAGYRIAPHSHSQPEIVTVISGTFRLGMGASADPGTARALPAGSFLAMPPGMVHYAIADQETVIQLNSTGPWTITYVNPQDDPRRAAN